MVKAKWKSLDQRPPPPLKPINWAETDFVMNKQPGWVRKSNEQYTQELKEKRNGSSTRPKNTGKKCDHCVMDDHHMCWRVVCYCPCYRERKLDGWPYTQTTL